MQTPHNNDSFFKKQVKLAISTLNVATVATFSITFWINASVLSLFLFMVVIAAVMAGDTSGGSEREYVAVYGSDTATHKILSIPIKGPIEGSVADVGYSIFADPTIAYGYDLKQEIIKAADSGEYDGLVLEINSPGGTIYGAKAISDGVKYFKEVTKKPVIASVQGMAASGAYWAAVSADQIIADSGTGIGSIGVIFGPFTYYDKPTADSAVTTQNGIEESYITAGEGKDAGNPFRRLTDQEKAIFQQGVDDSYDDFVNHVAQSRGIETATIRTKIGAHFYGDKQALGLKLIDSIGSPDVAYNALAKKAGVASDYQVVSSHSDPTGLPSLFGVHLPWKAEKVAKSSGTKAQVCTGQISVPLSYYGNPARSCQK